LKRLLAARAEAPLAVHVSVRYRGAKPQTISSFDLRRVHCKGRFSVNCLVNRLNNPIYFRLRNAASGPTFVLEKVDFNFEIL